MTNATMPIVTLISLATGASGSGPGPVLLAQEDAPTVGNSSSGSVGQEGVGSGQGGTQIEALPGENGSNGSGTQPTGTQPQGPSMWPLMIMMVVVFGFLIWQSSSAQRKEKKKREEMLSGLKRHDRVQTIGGIIGSVVEIKEGEVVLKVDEANNVKMRFTKSAVQQVLAEGEESSEAGLSKT